ncbi:MAG: hypothetical protein IJX28_05725 [Clostridia bacterium]|nr:hypothetical protein [Clostridia bacterium]
MKHIDLNFFPGWVRKSITFTIDDGNLKLDRKFLNITEPAGLKGTFNLNTPLKRGTPEEYVAFYKGYEITNHCKYHPMAFSPRMPLRPVAEEAFDKTTANPEFLYRAEEDGVYWGSDVPHNRWWHVATDEKYLACALDATEELENVFGKGIIQDFVWPFGAQENEVVFEGLKKQGYRSIRKTGCVKNSTNFALPADRMAWSYNANCNCMEECGAQYDALADDGELKFFCFGVHSHDFENADCWEVLIDFCNKYGNRPHDFWYASVGEIFDYEDAVKAVQITDTKIVNPSPVDLYIKIDGENIKLAAKSEMMI